MKAILIIILVLIAIAAIPVFLDSAGIESNIFATATPDPTPP